MVVSIFAYVCHKLSSSMLCAPNRIIVGVWMNCWEIVTWSRSWYRWMTYEIWGYQSGHIIHLIQSLFSVKMVVSIFAYVCHKLSSSMLCAPNKIKTVLDGYCQFKREACTNSCQNPKYNSLVPFCGDTMYLDSARLEFYVESLTTQAALSRHLITRNYVVRRSIRWILSV
jgi:hypothetical protein